MAETVEDLLSEECLRKLDKILDALVVEVMGEEADKGSDEETDRDFYNIQGADEQELEETCLEFDYENPSTLFMFSKRLYNRYRTSEDVSIRPENLLKTAIMCNRAALKNSPTEFDRITILYRLVPMLKDLFDYTGDKTDLDEAIEEAKELLAMSKRLSDDEEGQDMRLATMDELAAALDLRYSEYNDDQDLNEAFQLVQEALISIDDLTDRLAERRASLLIILAQLHERFYERTRSLSEIDKAIKATEEVVRLVPKDSPNWARVLSNLSRRFHSKYDQSRKLSDLTEAVKHARAAADVNPRLEDVLAECLSSLSASLASRYERTRDSRDINDARDAAQRAVDLPGQKGFARAAWLNDLVRVYCSLYVCEGELADVDQAISLARQAVNLSPRGTYKRLVSLHLLFVALAKKFERKRDNTSLEEATEAVQDIITSAPKTVPSRALAYEALGWLLQCRYEESRNRLDLDEAVKAARQSVKLAQKDDPVYASAVSNLGSRLICLYQTSGVEADLDSAIEHFRQAVHLTPNDDSDAVVRIQNLATGLKNRCIRTGEQDRNEALALFTEASRNPHGLPLNRIECARGAIAILVHKKDWTEAGTLAEEALKLVPLACRRYMSHEDQQYVIIQVCGLAADAASLSLLERQVEKALQQLEFGRGILLGYMIEDRSDLLALRKDHEDLARRYEFLRLRVNAEELEGYRTTTLPGDIAGEWSEGIQGQLISEWREVIARELAKDRREALQEIQDCVDKIRTVRGYERFQMAPEMDELKEQAVEGPIVVVNISEISSDAIILTLNGAKALRLSVPPLENAPLSIRQKFWAHASIRRRAVDDGNRPIMSADDPQTDSSSNEYSWLWTSCVKPVLDQLEAMGFLSSDLAQPPRVWWIGSGIASSFPFHAAGVDFGSKSVENTLNRVVPSYTTTIKALAYSRSRASMYTAEDAMDNKVDSILLVTMPTTPGQRDLPGVDAESAAIQKACKGFYSIDELRLRTARDVLKKLTESSVTHFACHGSSDPTEPFKSHLLLQKEVNGKLAVDKLTMSAISKEAAERRLLIAFLSACSTAEIKASQFADEGLHLASAFQMAGFEHVIGALWSANDAACARIAEEFYRELIRSGTGQLTPRVIAEALRHAVMCVRAEPHSKPSLWAPFILLGA